MPLNPVDEDSNVLVLLINGNRWAEFQLHPGFHDYEQTLSGDLVHQGWNILTFQQPSSEDPGSVFERSVRRVAWDRIMFGSTAKKPYPLPEISDGILSLPAGNEVAFNLDLPAEAWLALSPTIGTQKSGKSLVISWVDEGKDREIRQKVSLGSGHDRIQLTGDQPGMVRLALLNPSEGPAPVQLRELMILRRATSSNRPPGRNTDVSHRLYSPKTADSSNESQPNILLYLVDTLRSDHMGCYGYGRPTTPEIDKFAQQAILFENAQAQSPWTRASVASIFTGQWPEVHGAQDRAQVLAEESLTIAEILHTHGFLTFGVTGNGNSHSPWGFGQGFQALEYLQNLKPGQHFARSEDIHQTALEWIDQRDTSRPFFLWVHTIDPHAPYEPPEPFRSNFASSGISRIAGSVDRLSYLERNQSAVTQLDIDTMNNLYDAEIAANDASFGQFLHELRSRGLYDSTLIVFMSDHGEEFFEHGGWTHGKTLYAEMLDVPLIIKPPFWTKRVRSTDFAQHIDILPTVADFAGAEIPTGLPGTSLRQSMLEDPSTPPTSVAIAQMRLDGHVGSSMIQEHWKVVVRNYDGVDAFPRLHDRLVDRREFANLAAENPILAQRLAAELQRLEVLGVPLKDREELDLEANPELVEQLRALGYIE